jgi:hypothetical protein
MAFISPWTRKVHWRFWQPILTWKVFVSWIDANVTYARMGMTDRATDITQKILANGNYHFPAFWGPGYDWTPDFNWGGTGIMGLQEMLMQAIGEEIVLLPAWPEDWSADFKLCAPENTTIESKVDKWAIICLKVIPESRKKDVVIWNE